MKVTRLLSLALAASATTGVSAWADTSLTIGTVNNNEMIVMQKLSKTFETAHPDIHLKWVVLEENVLRQRLTADIATKSGQFDIMTIGLFEAPMWGQRGWLAPFTNVPASYGLDDVLKSERDGLSFDGKLYALPFYGESQLTIYRKDLFDKAGLTMPEQPTWQQVAEFAQKLHDPAHDMYGICLRGKAGWGENIGQVTPLVNSFGGRWFDMKWQPQLTSPAWEQGLKFYVDLLRNYGPPGASSNGYNETLALFATGKCAIYVDASVSAGFLSNPQQSAVHDKIAFAKTPYGKVLKGNHYLWSWALAIPASSKQQDAAKTFIYWATSRDYVRLVGETNGWATVPPGTRVSTYENPDYIKAAPFAKLTLEAMQTANPDDPTVDPVPYHGISHVRIPEFQSIGTEVGQQISAAIAGQKTVEDALQAAQDSTEREMRDAGYIKD